MEPFPAGTSVSSKSQCQKILGHVDGRVKPFTGGSPIAGGFFFMEFGPLQK